LGAEHGGDEKLEGVPEIELCVGVGVEVSQDAVDLPSATLERER
jgi:hypothetical protein